MGERRGGRSPGRPSREQQESRHRELLAAALDVFLEKGFEEATMDGIAARVGMSKRTMYARYSDKAALFIAVVRMATDLYTIPRETVEALVDADLRATLERIGLLRLANLGRPVVVKLQRLLNSQAYRFPDLFNSTLEQGAAPTLEVLVELFAKGREGGLRVTDPRRAAVAFLGLVVSAPGRAIVSGAGLGEDEMRSGVAFAVDIFLDGIRSR